MSTHAVILVKGKQYLVQKGDVFYVERLGEDKDKTISVPSLMSFDKDSSSVEIGTPELKSEVSLKIIEHEKGDKLRVAKFKSKVRYRKVRGFRPMLTKVEVLSI
jgi:large subunit ribosomal protein L21